VDPDLQDHAIRSRMSASDFPHSCREGTMELSRALRLHVPAGPAAVSEARHGLDPLEPELDSRLLNDMRLLVSELVTNSVRHTASDRVELEVMVSSDLIRVSVTDRGSGFEVSPRDEDADPCSGWGLFLVDQLADRWGVEVEDQTEVWFELRRAA